MNRLACTASLLMGFSAAWLAPASAQPYVPSGVARAPFTATLSNNVPLAFGITIGLAVVLFTVALYSQMKEPIKATISNQAYWPILFCLVTACLLCKSKKRR